MGTGCFHYQNVSFNESDKIGNKIINNQKYFSSPSIVKIVKIQAAFKSYLTQKILKNKIKIQTKKLIKLFDEKKLLNTEVITKSKSEIHYQELLNSNRIKPYSEYINRNPKLMSKLKAMSKYTIEIPYYVVTSSKEAYKGSWNFNKKFHGYGVIYQFNNITGKEWRIEGIFSDGILNGYGRIIISDEEMIRGDFALNKLNGLGEYHRKDGSIYSGAFYGGYPQGNGRETFKDGSFFEGYYFKGKKKYGKFVWKDKNRYEGNFEKDLFEGQGTYIWGDKKMYIGNWKEGKMNGVGKLTYSDGSYYEGNFVNGLKEGQGKYVWKVYHFYKGEWKNDKQNGYGVLYKNGQKIRGIWENGKLKNETYLNTQSNVRLTTKFSVDKEKEKKFSENENIFTYPSNNGMIEKVSGDKKSDIIYGKINEDDIDTKKENSKYSLRSSFGSVYTINSADR